jgi:phosphate transport system ATP-binding protein
MTAAVSVQELVVRAGERVLVGPVSFTVDSGTTVGLAGPSGVGKSTVLRALVGLLPAGLTVEGELRLLGQRLDGAGSQADLRSRCVLVGQTPVVFPGSVLDNALFGLRHVVRAPKAQLRERAESALKEVGLYDEVADRLDSSAATLSVGQRQRLCLARAVALDPAVLLLDEPTSALDATSRGTVEESVAALRGHRTVLLVSHDPDQVARLCDHVVHLAGTTRV